MTALAPLPAADPHARLLHAYLDGLRSPNTADTYRRDITHRPKERAVPQPTPPNPPDDLRDVPPTVLAMADRVVLRLHELIDGAPLALVVNAYRAGYAHGRMEAAAAIRAGIDPSTMRKFTCEVMEAAAKVADLPEPEPQPTIPTSSTPAVVKRRKPNTDLPSES